MSAQNQSSTKIAVVVAVKDDGEGLRRTLASVLDQDSSVRVDIIVIDGGSTDDTLSVISQHRASITYWESGLDSGISDAFNRGISKARADLIAILNAGDEWYSYTASTAARHHALFPGQILHGPVTYAARHGKPEYHVRPDPQNIHKRMTMFHPTMFVPAQIYDSVGPYREDFRYAMDSEWCHRAISNGHRFQTMDAPIAKMELGGRSDVHYAQSLREYRRSVTMHRLCGPWRATCYFCLFTARKFLGRWLARDGIRTKLQAATNPLVSKV